MPDDRQMPREVAEQFFAEFYGGAHHIPGKIREWGHGWYVNDSSSRLSTYDFAYLTRLVFLAHDRCIRVELGAVNMQYIRLAIHPRKRTGPIYDRHPTLAEAIAEWREHHPVAGNG